MNSIQAFWSEFRNLHPQLAGESPSQQAMDRLLEALRRIDPRLYYHLGSKDTATDLIISAEGHTDLMPILAQLERTAPGIGGWGIVIAYEGMLLFGERNEDVFPLTESGDVLYRMAQHGDALWIERKIDFAFVFPSKKDATMFCTKAAADHVRGEVRRYRAVPGYSFQAEIHIDLIPTHEAITSAEQRFGRIAAEFNGRADGWGCFDVRPA